MIETTASDILIRLFEAAVSAVSAEKALPGHLPPPPKGRTLMIAVGKAAAAMAQVALTKRPDITSGLVVIPYGHAVPDFQFPAHIEVIEASHPVPDEQGMKAAEKALNMAGRLGADDQLLALISGGGSSLLVLPAPGISLEKKRDITQKLLYSGATIMEINSVRARLSRIKGGRLARAALPAQIVTLVISDVPGDDPAYVASGPTVMGRISPEDGLAIMKKYHLDIAPTPQESLPKDADTDTTVIAIAEDALKAAAEMGAARGYHITSLGGALEGEASVVAQDHAKRVLMMAQEEKPSLLLSGGETSVTISAKTTGRGGRNCEYLLALVLALDGAADIYAIACDTDGIDGSEDNAGAVISPTTLFRARALGMDAAAYLARHDSYGFFERLGDLVITGPTLTNVNDFRAILIKPGLL